MATKLCDMDENSSVIVEFERFLRSSKFETSTNQADLSTIRKHKGHLFLYEDSLLQYQYKKDPQYNLQRHFDPQSKLFLEVQDPTGVEGWINSIAGSGGKDNPGRRKEMLKSHARWREFVQERLENENFGDGAEGHIRRDMVLKNFDKISKKVKGLTAAFLDQKLVPKILTSLLTGQGLMWSWRTGTDALSIVSQMGNLLPVAQNICQKRLKLGMLWTSLTCCPMIGIQMSLIKKERNPHAGLLMFLVLQKV
jgi:hypothetical protein